MVSNATSQLNFKKLPCAKFGCSIKEEIEKFEKAIKTLPVPTIYLCEARFPSYTSAKITSLVAEAEMNLVIFYQSRH